MAVKIFNLAKFLEFVSIKIPPSLQKLLEKILAIHRLNDDYNAIHAASNGDSLTFFTNACRHFNLRAHGEKNLLERIPTQGSLIVAINHPTGFAELLLIMQYLLQIRRDVKVLGNFILDLDDIISKHIIPVNPFSQDHKTNVLSITEAQNHLREQHCLVIFPAGEVASFQASVNAVYDPPWQEVFVHLAAQNKAPIISIHAQGKNSRWFYALGRLHPLLRTFMLPRMLLRQAGKIFELTTSHPIIVSKPLKDLSQTKLTQWLYYFNYAQPDLELMSHNISQWPDKPLTREPIAVKPTTKDLINEINQLPANALLFTIGHYEVYATTGKEIPHLMHAISIEREYAFREKNLGTGKAYDSDQFDDHYLQLFIWDTRQQQLAGGSRFCFFSHQKWQQSFSRSYLSTLFNIQPHLLPQANFVEIGRTFICKNYLRSPSILSLIWRGLFKLLVEQNARVDYVIGVTSFNAQELHPFALQLFLAYLQQKNQQMPAWSRHFQPLYPYAPANVLPPNITRVLEQTTSFKHLEIMVKACLNEQGNLPSLFANYEALGSYFGQLSIDENFSNCIDVLSIWDLDDAKFDKAKFHLAADDIAVLKSKRPSLQQPNPPALSVA